MQPRQRYRLSFRTYFHCIVHRRTIRISGEGRLIAHCNDVTFAGQVPVVRSTSFSPSCAVPKGNTHRQEATYRQYIGREGSDRGKI